ncbi:MAG: hypothetical protein KDI65_04165, partial [Alphaproteobacteria bacterium]|nr:hypothetical protein [Alphaproteobacteria bacterium]
MYGPAQKEGKRTSIKKHIKKLKYLPEPKIPRKTASPISKIGKTIAKHLKAVRHAMIGIFFNACFLDFRVFKRKKNKNKMIKQTKTSVTI